MQIHSKLILSFIPLPLLAIASVGYLLNQNSREALLQNLSTRFATVALLKTDKLDKFIEESSADVQSLSTMLGNLAETTITQATVGHELKNSKKELDRILIPIEKTYEAADIMLADKYGRFFYSSNPTHNTFDIGQIIIPNALDVAQSGVYIGEIQMCPDTVHPYTIMFTTKILDRKGHLIGYISLEQDTASVYKILADNTGLGETGESFIVKKGDHNQIISLSPLRHKSNAILNPMITAGDGVALPAQDSLSGHSNTGFSVDYRGKKVLASWKYIPRLNWGLVVKIDEEEALVGIKQQGLIAFILTTFSVWLLLITTWLISRSISKPIQELQAGAVAIAHGNWDYHVSINSKDEIGQLGKAFNHMTTSLKTKTDELTHEISDRKAVEARLEQSKRDLETLLYVTSHDLKEPLRAVEYFSSAVYDRYADKLDDKGQDYLNRAKEASKRMVLLIDDILTLSRARKIVRPEKSYNTQDFVKEALARLSNKIASTGAKISIAEDLPQLNVDPFWATQAIYNLVGNALKFVNPGQPPDISIASYRGDRGLGLSVLDRGPGVPQEYAENIFGLFKRAVGRDIEGTGAGLAIVKEIALRHGGEAWVSPREGGGSIFTISFGKLQERNGND